MRIFIIGLLFLNPMIAFSMDGLEELDQFGDYDPLSEMDKFDNHLKTQMPWETNYWECILDEMPGAKTKTVALAVKRKCNQYGKNYKIEKKSSFFGIKNASECVIEYASDTPSETAAKAIRAACNKLYVR